MGFNLGRGLGTGVFGFIGCNWAMQLGCWARCRKRRQIGFCEGDWVDYDVGSRVWDWTQTELKIKNKNPKITFEN